MATDSSNAIPTYGEVQNMLQSSTGDLHKWVAWSAFRNNATINKNLLLEYIIEKVTVLHVSNAEFEQNKSNLPDGIIFDGIIFMGPQSGTNNVPLIIGGYYDYDNDNLYHTVIGTYSLNNDYFNAHLIQTE